jgi:hypothetical protein
MVRGYTRRGVGQWLSFSSEAARVIAIVLSALSQFQGSPVDQASFHPLIAQNASKKKTSTELVALLPLGPAQIDLSMLHAKEILEMTSLR